MRANADQEMNQEIRFFNIYKAILLTKSGFISYKLIETHISKEKLTT